MEKEILVISKMRLLVKSKVPKLYQKALRVQLKKCHHLRRRLKKELMLRRHLMKLFAQKRLNLRRKKKMLKR